MLKELKANPCSDQRRRLMTLEFRLDIKKILHAGIYRKISNCNPSADVYSYVSYTIPTCGICEDDQTVYRYLACKGK